MPFAQFYLAIEYIHQNIRILLKYRKYKYRNFFSELGILVVVAEVGEVRVPLILKKISDHFPNWAKVVPWAKGQLGQIWANLVKK